MLIRHYHAEEWLSELFSATALIKKAEPITVRLTKVQVRHPYALAWSVSIAAGFTLESRVIELLWFCGAQTPENTASVEQLVEERLAYLRSKLGGIGFQIEGGRFLTELEAAI